MRPAPERLARDRSNRHRPPLAVPERDERVFGVSIRDSRDAQAGTRVSVCASEMEKTETSAVSAPQTVAHSLRGIPRTKTVWELLRNAARHRYVLQNFVARDLRVKYRGSFLGYMWSLLEPLSLVGVYYFVFVLIARRGGPDYPLVVALGILPYTFFSSVVTGGAGALTSNRSLIRRVFIPRELFVVGHVGSQLAVFGFSLLAVVPLLFVYGQMPGWRIVLLPLAILLLTLLATGLALSLACANVLYRDVTYVLRVVLRVVFYASPVIYPLSLVPERLRSWYLLNPLATLLSMTRTALTDAPLEVPLPFAGLAVGLCLGAFALGAAVFTRWQSRAVKYL